MVKLAEEMYKRFKPEIESWTEKDIYAVSFFVYDDEDDVLKPTATLGYNTETYYKASIKGASDDQEAKWNYAFWPQNEVLAFGVDNTAPLVHQWIIENGLEAYTEENKDEMYDENMVYIGKGPLLTQKFVEVLIEVANRLHAENVLINKFGKDIPIIIHELEYYDAIANETKMANPQGQADEFVNWVLNPPLSPPQEKYCEPSLVYKNIYRALIKALGQEKAKQLISEQASVNAIFAQMEIQMRETMDADLEE